MCEKQAEKIYIFLWDSSIWILGFFGQWIRASALGRAAHSSVEPWPVRAVGTPPVLSAK